MTVNNAHAYCDESGNTGANLLDPNQPLLVVGGWLVNDGLIEAAEQIVRENIELIAPLDNELHGIRLLRNEAGTRGILNLVQVLQRGCGAICQIVEKRVLLVNHVFDIFLKPRFNLNVPASFEDYFEGKRELFEKVYGLPDEILAEFVEAYDTLDRSLLLESLRKITTGLSLRLETKLADLMLGSMPHINAIIEHHMTGRVHHDSITMNTPNVASFYMFFHSMEQIGRDAKIPRITLVHDESPQFSAAFPEIFELFRDDNRHDVIKDGPYGYVFRGFESLKDFRFADSKNEPLLQAADVLVSAMHRYATNVYKDAPNSATLTEIARLFLAESPPYPTIIRTTVADWFVNKLYDSAD
jgi:hypothetical protein